MDSRDTRVTETSDFFKISQPIERQEKGALSTSAYVFRVI